MSLQSLCFAISRRNLCLSLRYALGQFKLFFKIRERRLDPRVLLERQRLRVTMAVDGEPDGVGAGRRPRASSGSEEAGHRIPSPARAGVAQVPLETVHAGLGGKRLGGVNPKHGDVELLRVHLRGLLLARIPTREFSRAVKNFKRHGSRWGRLQVIGDDCAARGILTLGDLGRQGSPFKRRRADAKGRPWPEQVFAGGSNARGKLP